MYSLALPMLLRWVLCVNYYQMFWDEVHALRQSEANCIRHVQPWSWRNTWKGNFHFTRFYISIKCWDADIGYILVVFVFSTQGQWMNYLKQITVKIKSCAMKSGAEVFFIRQKLVTREVLYYEAYEWSKKNATTLNMRIPTWIST